MRARASRPSELRPIRAGFAGDPDRRDPALALVRPPPSLRLVAIATAVAFVVLALVLVVVPWQQSALGTGRVVAYAPADRQQLVEAPVSGRLDRWLVSEGTVVEAGDPLIEILDNDPALVSRLDAQWDATVDEAGSVEAQIRSYAAKVAAAKANREMVLAEYDSKIAELAQKRVGDQAALDAAKRQADRMKLLADEGIASQRELELAIASSKEASAKLEARNSEIAATRRARDKAGADADTKIASAEAELEQARTKRASVSRSRLDLETKRARQETQLVRAPRGGTVLRLYGGPGGGQIKAGDPLLTLVPTTESRAVELWVDGNDMPFVQQGSHVRVVFEGWPALQVVGLPGASQGTFGAEVAFVDATDDGAGRFRVVVVPEPGGDPWPSSGSLRQGVRAKGWVMLGEVSLGYELWRQLNGFPPLPDVEKGETPWLPSTKKNRAPTSLK